MTIIRFIDRYMALIVLGFAAVAFFLPESFGWIPSASINYLLGLIMLLMGMTMKAGDIKVVFTRPRDIILGCTFQFAIMPFLAWVLTKLFSLPQEYAIGVILVGCCPGGTASNVITYLACGDLALSIGMTSVSTLVAPLLTPLACLLYAGTLVQVDVLGMLISIVEIVILPIAIGFILQHSFPKFTQSISKVLPALSTLVISLIVGIIIAKNSTALHNTGAIILLVVILHNLSGLLVGYAAGRLAKMTRPKRIAVSIEIGMQNSGLACSLAQQHFQTLQMATVPGAIYSVWHNISGAILARIFRLRSISKAEQHGVSE